MNDIDLDFQDSKKEEKKHMLSFTLNDEYQPIQKNTKLFKFILYTTKVEIKSNSLIKMIYTTSLFEMALWIIGFLLFLVAPKELYLIWVLIVHMFKGMLGLVILRHMPKTYEIMDNLYKNPNFEEDKIMEMIDTQIRETFMDRWSQNKRKLLWYLILTIVSLVFDIVIFIVEIVLYGRKTLFIMNTALLFIILVFISKIILFLY
jgi:hypothetical protein